MKTITLAHSPDSDDAFMHYALATNKIETGKYRFKHILKDIQTLNEAAREGVYDITAISFHAYAYVSDKYALLPHGASIGDGYGPIVVTTEQHKDRPIKKLKIAIPGTMTSAYLALKLYEPNFDYEVVAFDEIIAHVKAGKADAGLLIHEGQLFYQDYDLYKILDLGEWWKGETGLPLPMGGNVIKRDLGQDAMREISAYLHQSIEYSMEHREDALAYAMQFARDMKTDLADRFVRMWVNDLTLDYGERGREAVRRFLKEGVTSGVITQDVQVDFVE